MGGPYRLQDSMDLDHAGRHAAMQAEFLFIIHSRQRKMFMPIHTHIVLREYQRPSGFERERQLESSSPERRIPGRVYRTMFSVVLMLQQDIAVTHKSRIVFSSFSDAGKELIARN